MSSKIGRVHLRMRDICCQIYRENEVDILGRVLSSDHVHMFVPVPPKIAASDLVRKMKGRSPHKVQREFPELRRRYWGRRSTILIAAYPESHRRKLVSGLVPS